MTTTPPGPRTARALPARFVRHEPGTSSPTVSTLRLDDGTRSYVDLVRLNPGLAAFTLEHPGVAPGRPCGYRVTDARVDARVRRVLLGSFPHVPTRELSARVRAAGLGLGHRDLREHEAIAATQAAVWHLTAGVRLDVRERTEPLAVHGTGDVADVDAVTSPDRRAATGRALPDAPVAVALELAGPVALRGYEVRTGPGGDDVRVHLEASTDGTTWRRVAGSAAHVPASGTVVHALAPLATVATSRYPQPPQGYRHYRVVVAGTADAPARVRIAHVRLLPAGGERYATPTPVVLLYRYLLEVAARPDAPAADGPTVHGPTLVDTPPAGGLVGPYVVLGDADDDGRVAVTATGAAHAVGRDARPLRRVAPGERFWVRVPAGPDGRLTLVATRQPEPAVEVRALVADAGPGGSAAASTLVAVVPASAASSASLDVDHLVLAPAVRAPR